MSRTRRLLATTATLAWTLIVTHVAAHPAAAAPIPGPDFYGTNSQPLFNGIVPPERWPAFLNRMSADGLRTARITASWIWAEPHAPAKGAPHTYDWSPASRPNESHDRLILALASAGIRPVAVVGAPSYWVGGGGVTVKPSKYPDLAAFTAAFAARYGEGGTFWAAHPELARYAVHDIELWTEANSANFWTRHADPLEYVRGLQVIRPALRAANPHTRLLASIGWQGFEAYVTELYANGVKGLVDAIGFHPYAPHTPAMLSLVARLRATLRAAGEGDLPITVTETGQPRSHDGDPSARAGEGLVTDEARAATQSMTADALARSDCGVENILVYSSVGSETNAEPISEGFMGIYQRADAEPNATGRAFGAAAQRWRATPSSSLVLCGAGSTAHGDLLPLESTMTHTTPTCAVARITYFGNPVEGPTLTLRVADGRSSRFEVDAFGFGEVCIPDGPPIHEFEVIAEIPGIATSARWQCPVDPGPCFVPQPPPPPVTPPVTSVVATDVATPVKPAAAVTAAACRYRITVKLRRATRRRTHLSARASCSRRNLRARYVVSVRRNRARKRKTVRTVWLQTNVTRKFQARLRLRAGDRIYLTRAADKTTGTPRLITSARASRKLVKRG